MSDASPAPDEPWWVFRGTNVPRDVEEKDWPAPPPWRDFAAKHGGRHGPTYQGPSEIEANSSDEAKGKTYVASPEAKTAVSAALCLRRPLLVTGPPGSGKSSLAAAVAYELKLGPVLVWPVTSRSTLSDGLYYYDAIARLHDSQADPDHFRPDEYERYLSLNAVGTAMLPQDRPRALLIDELDKADPDLPNDLLNLFEDGWYEVPLLRRLEERPDDRPLMVSTKDGKSHKAHLKGDRVHCKAFPFVVITSNREREFAPAFLRRCVQLTMEYPTDEKERRAWLKGIVQSQFPEYQDHAAFEAHCQRLVQEFDAPGQGQRATDQLLNALHAIKGLKVSGTKGREELQKALFKRLDPQGPS